MPPLTTGVPILKFLPLHFFVAQVESRMIAESCTILFFAVVVTLPNWSRSAESCPRPGALPPGRNGGCSYVLFNVSSLGFGCEFQSGTMAYRTMGC